MEKFSTVVWTGGLKDGEGRITSESGALKDVPFSFATRFEESPGSNPEELVGAALAACFSMALSQQLEKSGFTPAKINASASVKLVKQDEGFEISDVYLSAQGIVPEIDETTFRDAAELTKKTCPMAKVLNASIHLETQVLATEERIAG